MANITGKKLKSVTFLIPAFNDEKTIEAAIREAAEVGKKAAQAHKILVIDDGGSDRTADFLKSLLIKYPNLKVYTHGANLGYGATIKELYYKGQTEWLFSVPGDYQIGAKELLKLMPLTDSADMILGWRRFRHDPVKRLFQSWLYNSLVRLLFGLSVHDVNSVRLMRSGIIRNIKLTSDSAFVDAELIIKASQAGYRVTEGLISHRARTGSRGGGGSYRTILGTIVEMIRFRISPH